MPDFFGASCGLPHRLAGKGKEATHMSDNGNHHRWRPGGRDLIFLAVVVVVVVVDIVTSDTTTHSM